MNLKLKYLNSLSSVYREYIDEKSNTAEGNSADQEKMASKATNFLYLIKIIRSRFNDDDEFIKLLHNHFRYEGSFITTTLENSKEFGSKVNMHLNYSDLEAYEEDIVTNLITKYNLDPPADLSLKKQEAHAPSAEVDIALSSLDKTIEDKTFEWPTDADIGENHFSDFASISRKKIGAYLFNKENIPMIIGDYLKNLCKFKLIQKYYHHLRSKTDSFDTNETIKKEIWNGYTEYVAVIKADPDIKYHFVQKCKDASFATVTEAQQEIIADTAYHSLNSKSGIGTGLNYDFT